jgi:hypothetical protein
MKSFCGEIQYDNEDAGIVHSDICTGCCGWENDVELTEEKRKFYHDALDEWLNKSNGTGWFFVGDSLEMRKLILEAQ